MVREQGVAHPVVSKWNFSIVTLNQSQVSMMSSSQPTTKLVGITHRRRKQHGPDMTRQQAQRKFPDNSTLRLIEAVELVHHNTADIPKIKCFIVHQAIEQDLGHHDQHISIRVHTAIACHESDLISVKAPSFSRRLKFVKLLIRQCDQRRGVIEF